MQTKFLIMMKLTLLVVMYLLLVEGLFRGSLQNRLV